MIKFDRLWETLKQKEMTKYNLREICGIDNKTIRRLEANANLEMKTVNKLCWGLKCRLEDIAEYVYDSVADENLVDVKKK